MSIHEDPGAHMNKRRRNQTEYQSEIAINHKARNFRLAKRTNKSLMRRSSRRAAIIEPVTCHRQNARGTESLRDWTEVAEYRTKGRGIGIEAKKDLKPPFRNGKGERETAKTVGKRDCLSREALAQAEVISPEEASRIMTASVSIAKDNYQAFIDDTVELEKFANANDGVAFAVYSEGKRVGGIQSSYDKADELAYEIYCVNPKQEILVQQYPNTEFVDLPGVMLEDE